MNVGVGNEMSLDPKERAGSFGSPDGDVNENTGTEFEAPAGEDGAASKAVV